MGAHLLRTVPRPRTQNITSGQVTAAADLTGLRVRAYFALVGCLASVGMAGSFIVPFLVAMRLPQRSAVALASWLGIAIAGVASTVYAANAQAHPLHTAAFPGLLGVVHVPAVALLAIGSYAAARAGARFATHVRPAHLQRAIGGALILSGLYTILVRL